MASVLKRLRLNNCKKSTVYQKLSQFIFFRETTKALGEDKFWSIGFYPFHFASVQQIRKKSNKYTYSFIGAPCTIYESCSVACNLINLDFDFFFV